MSPERLVYMANQITRFFRHEPDERAVADTADHLRLYWDPRMRKEIREHAARGGAGLDPLTLQAVESLEG